MSIYIPLLRSFGSVVFDNAPNVSIALTTECIASNEIRATAPRREALKRNGIVVELIFMIVGFVKWNRPAGLPLSAIMPPLTYGPSCPGLTNGQQSVPANRDPAG